MVRSLKTLVLTMCLIGAQGSLALADQIDGDWCSSDGQSISIDGSQVRTTGGQTVTANYDRHHVDFTIPEGEANAGAKFVADQLDEEQIKVNISNGSRSIPGMPAIWKPCKPTV